MRCAPAEKPSWGKWQLRDLDVIDVWRIPSESPDYCYGSRTMYVDWHFHYGIWIDLYDANLKLSKITWGARRAKMVPKSSTSPQIRPPALYEMCRAAI